MFDLHPVCTALVDYDGAEFRHSACGRATRIVGWRLGLARTKEGSRDVALPNQDSHLRFGHVASGAMVEDAALLRGEGRFTAAAFR